MMSTEKQQVIERNKIQEPRSITTRSTHFYTKQQLQPKQIITYKKTSDLISHKHGHNNKQETILNQYNEPHDSTIRDKLID
ncbi:hypothetical protein HanIR_Chr12g0575751 [Helianthus annuus]|nr:hypothetical protein HanIR_Chr12g0575751 [Helianthus annuus]